MHGSDSTWTPHVLFFYCCSFCFEADRELYLHRQMEKGVVKLLKEKMLVVPGLIRMNSAAWGEMMYSYIWAFCFARWFWAGTVKLLWPHLLQNSSSNKNVSNEDKKAPLWMNKPQLLCYVDIISCSGCDLWTNREQGHVLKKCQLGLVLIKHPVQTDNNLNFWASRGNWL